MKTTILFQVLGAAACLTLANCALWPYPNSEEAAKRDGSGYSLDDPASGSRYMAGADNAAPSGPAANPNAASGPSSPSDTVAPSTSPAPEVSVAPPTPPPTQPAAAPTYGTPVPGRRGFVYPPGVETKPENMVDVRDFQPGQKVRDPRTGKIFLVP